MPLKVRGKTRSQSQALSSLEVSQSSGEASQSSGEMASADSPQQAEHQSMSLDNPQQTSSHSLHQPEQQSTSPCTDCHSPPTLPLFNEGNTVSSPAPQETALAEEEAESRDPPGPDLSKPTPH